MRQGAQRRFTPAGTSSRVDELAQSLSYLEERHPFLGDVDARPRLGIAALARVPVTDAEAAEPPQLDLVALRQRVGDVVEDRVDDRSEEHTSELQSLAYLVCRLLLEKKKKNYDSSHICVARLVT